LASNDVSFLKLREGNYSVRIDINSDNRQDSSIRFNLRKFQNFIIKEDIVDMITGELEKENGKITNYVILNDVTKPANWLASLWVIDLISETDYKEYV